MFYSLITFSLQMFFFCFHTLSFAPYELIADKAPISLDNTNISLNTGRSSYDPSIIHLILTFFSTTS